MQGISVEPFSRGLTRVAQTAFLHSARAMFHADRHGCTTLDAAIGAPETGTAQADRLELRLQAPKRKTMLYHLHELNRTLLNPLVAWSGAAARALSAPDNWLSRVPGMDRVAAGYELLYRLGKDYEKPAFNITSVLAHGREAPVVEQRVIELPFCHLLHFKRCSDDPDALKQLRGDPNVLVVAPSVGPPRDAAARHRAHAPARSRRLHHRLGRRAHGPARAGPVPSRRLRQLHAPLHDASRRCEAARDLGVPADRAGARGRFADGVGRRTDAAHADA